MLEVRILPGEPKFFDLKRLQSLGRAFGSRPNAWAFGLKSKLPHVAEICEFSAIHPISTRRCHKNVIVPPDSGASRSCYWSRSPSFMAEKDARERRRLRFATEGLPISEVNGGWAYLPQMGYRSQGAVAVPRPDTSTMLGMLPIGASFWNL
jgi:hypothetical protein